jgi:hypothetical protein
MREVELPRIDDSSGPLKAINVDVGALDRFAGSVEAEVTASYTPHAVDLMQVYAVGAHFGLGHASPDVLAARTRYTECLQGAVEQLAGYANAVAILVDAARTVAARYRDTDALAASNALEVGQALSAATHAARDVLAGAGVDPPGHGWAGHRGE